MTVLLAGIQRVPTNNPTYVDLLPHIQYTPESDMTNEIGQESCQISQSSCLIIDSLEYVVVILYPYLYIPVINITLYQYLTILTLNIKSHIPCTFATDIYIDIITYIPNILWRNIYDIVIKKSTQFYDTILICSVKSFIGGHCDVRFDMI